MVLQPGLSGFSVGLLAQLKNGLLLYLLFPCWLHLPREPEEKVGDMGLHRQRNEVISIGPHSKLQLGWDKTATFETAVIVIEHMFSECYVPAVGDAW